MDQYNVMNDGINISDVIEAIENTDPGLVERTGKCEDKARLNMMSGGSMGTATPTSSMIRGPYVKIIEQPASKALRFRYECEGRSAGSIPGINSTPQLKTFPSIKIIGYSGRAVVVVSCVTKDPPYRPHPHNLVGKESCKHGVCTVEIASETMTVTFVGLGIQCVKRKNIQDSLRIREEIRVDPYRTGFEHKRKPLGIDLNAIRLCFQVFIEGSEKGKFTVPLQAIVSDPIYDKKAMSDLVICKLSHCSASAAGGMEMILLCEKVAKEDIQVRFFEERDGQIVWEGLGDFQPSHVHKQVAITFKTPVYCNQHIDQPAYVNIQLLRPSDLATSDALPFQMLPLGADDPVSLKRKRKKFNNYHSSHMLRDIQTDVAKYPEMMEPGSSIQYTFNAVKPEPQDQISYGGPIATHSMPMCPENDSFVLSPVSNLSMQRSPNMTHQYQLPHIPSPNYQPPVVTYDEEQMNFDQATSKPSEIVEMQQPVLHTDGANGTLGLESNQFNFDMSQLVSLNQLNSTELAVLGTALSDNFSSGLLISDAIQTNAVKELRDNTVRSTGEPTNMSDSFTRLTDTTIEELCTLNSLYNPTKDDGE